MTDTPILLAVRHAEAQARADVPTKQWGLTPAGVEAARALGEDIARRHPGRAWRIVSSDEVKALETAHAIAGALGAEVRPTGDLREVGRPWTDSHDDYLATVELYLSGVAMPGWEPPTDVIAGHNDVFWRIEHEPSVILVGHGVALSVWLTAIAPSVGTPFEFWRALRFPDVRVVDVANHRVEVLA